MRRIAAGIATVLLAAVAISGPLASTGQAGPAALQCATGTPPAACALLDQLAAQLQPVASLLGVPLADLTGPALGFAARSDQPAGVPVAEVLTVSESLNQALSVLPDSVGVLLGQARLDGLSSTLTGLVAALSAPAPSGQESAGTSEPTPAKVSPATSYSSSTSAPRTSSSSSLGGSASAPASSSSTSSAAVPNVPVGDPLTLAPLGMPEFGFSQTFEPLTEPLVTDASLSPESIEEAALAESIASLPKHDGRTELGVVVVLSLILIAGAGLAQVQQNRHVIPD